MANQRVDQGVWTWVNDGLKRHLHDADDPSEFFNLNWNYYIVTVLDYEGRNDVRILVQAESEAHAIGVAYAYLADEGDNFRLPGRPNVQPLDIDYDIAQNLRIPDSTQLISQSIDEIERQSEVGAISTVLAAVSLYRSNQVKTRAEEVSLRADEVALLRTEVARLHKQQAEQEKEIEELRSENALLYRVLRKLGVDVEAEMARIKGDSK